MTDQVTDFDKPYRDCYAVQEALRRIGFSADDIYVGFGTVSGIDDVLYVQLRAQGKIFTVTVAKIPGAAFDDVVATWQTFAYALPGMSEGYLQRILDEAPITKDFVPLLVTLQSKGFKL